MKPNTTNDPDDITDADDRRIELGRRQLLKTAAGATAIGTVGAASPASPIGTAEAAPPLLAAALVPYATGKAATALAGLGIGAAAGYYFSGGEIDVDEITDSASQSEIYSIIANAMRNQNSIWEYLGDEHGFDTDTGELVEPQDNDFVHSLMEHSTGTAAKIWADGGTLFETQEAAREAVYQQAVLAEWNVVHFWNEFVAAISPALVAYYNLFGEDSNGDDVQLRHDHAFEYNFRISTDTLNSDSYDPVVADQLTAEHSGKDIIGSRDYAEDLPINPVDLPEQERPANGFVVYTIGGRTGSYDRRISPLDDSSTLTFAVEYEPTGAREAFDVAMVRDFISAIRTMRNDVDSNLDQTIQNLYDGLQSGQITVGDVMSPRMVYQQYTPADEQSLNELYLQSMGNLSSGGPGSATMLIDGTEYRGSLYPEVIDETVLKAGDTLLATEYAIAMVNISGSSQPITFSDVDIEIVEIEGAEQLTFSPRQRLGPQGVTPSEFADRVEEQQERTAALEARIEELEAAAFPFGEGGGGASGLLGLGVLAAVVGYLFGR